MIDNQKWFRERAAEFSGSLLFDEPLSRYTFYRIGGPAKILTIPKQIQDLRLLVEGISKTGSPYFILGQGSNILVSDQGYDGIVIRTPRLNSEIERVDSSSNCIRIRTGSGVMVSSLLRRAGQEGWGGLEFLTGIPGTIGGVVTMNAGTHLGEARDALRRVEYYSLQQEVSQTEFSPKIIDHSDFQFEYRKNLSIPPDGFIWSAEWEVQKCEPLEVKQKIDETLARRKATQPIDYPSCGSVFKNPKAHAISAWQVIERLGLRGHQIGNAQFSEKHCNFIINLGKATAADVSGLIELAKARALKELGIRLEEEVIYLG